MRISDWSSDVCSSDLGGWCWKPIADQLRSAGHDVYTPTQTGLGERKHLMSADISMETFVLDVLNVILSEDLTDVILVGHSYGGRSISGVVDRAPARIHRLVYIEGGLAPDGRSQSGRASGRERGCQ